jgi:uncharacterized protein (DUF302 family)
MMSSIAIAFLAAGLLLSPQDDGLVRVRSSRSMSETVAALDSAISALKLTLFAKVDHAANAKAAGMTLRPTTVFILGNPAVGTEVMQCRQTAAIDLPLRILVWEDEVGAVWVAYASPETLATRHDLGSCKDVLARMSTGLGALVRVAARPSP